MGWRVLVICRVSSAKENKSHKVTACCQWVWGIILTFKGQGIHFGLSEFQVHILGLLLTHTMTLDN